jgi:hypothetical protein
VKYYLKELALFTAMASIFGEVPLIAYYQQLDKGIKYVEDIFGKSISDFGLLHYRVR